MLKFFNANLSLDSLKILSKNKKFSILSQTYQTVFEWTSFLHRGGSHDRKMFSAQKKKKNNILCKFVAKKNQICGHLA